MKHGRLDYQRIQDPHNKIPHDEPVFLLRAKDTSAADTVRCWAMLHKARGGDPHDVRNALLQATSMDNWPQHKIADIP